MIIYKAKFPNNKIYIGQTSRSLEERIYDHSINFKHPYKKNRLYSAIKKYGINSIAWEVIYKANTKEELNEREIYFISTFKSFDKNFGYNTRLGGSSGKWSEESKNLFSKKKKGKSPHPIEFYINLGKRQSGSLNPFYGKTHSDEVKEKLKNLRLGKKLSEKTRAKISKGPIVVLKKNTNELVAEFSSAFQCSIQMNLNNGHICSILRGDSNIKSLKGFIFKFKRDYK